MIRAAIEPHLCRRVSETISRVGRIRLDLHREQPAVKGICSDLIDNAIGAVNFDRGKRPGSDRKRSCKPIKLCLTLKQKKQEQQRDNSVDCGRKC